MAKAKKREPKKIAVIFDMDGVIVDNSGFHQKAWILFCKRHGFKLTKKQFNEKYNGRLNSEILKRMFGSLSKKQIAKYVSEKESLYRKAYSKSIKPAPGLVRLLKELEKRGIKTAVATAAPPANVDFVLGKTGVRKFFKVIFDDSKVKKGKPNPEIYLKASKKLGVKPKDCVVFEDGLLGIQAGKNAGMQVIGITTTHPKKELKKADLTINSFSEVDFEMLEKL